MKKLLLTMSLVAVILGACGTNNAAEETESNPENLDNLTEEGLPIVNETIELEFFTEVGNQSADWNDIYIWNEYEEMTNMKINFDQYLPEALAEQRNLALVQSDLPDVFFHSYFPTPDVLRYGKQGVFIPLNDLIEEHAPNLQQIMDEYPEVERAITMEDGNIYSMPMLIHPDFTSMRMGSNPFINQEWLEELGMEKPETVDEFYDYLVAVKEADPAGNGRTIPYGGTSVIELVEYLAGGFGVMNQGFIEGFVDLDENEQVRFYPKEDRYRELLEFVHKIYSEGLMDENIFSIQWDQYLANAAEGVYGSTIFYEPVELFGEEVGSMYDGLGVLEGPEGKAYTKVYPLTFLTGNFILTNENPYPEATVRWLDYFYSEEGTKFYYMGKEGETYVETEDGLEYVEEVVNPGNGMTQDQAIRQYFPWPGKVTGMARQEYFSGSETGEVTLRNAEEIGQHIPDMWAQFPYTDEEYDFLASTGADIDSFVHEMRDNFISGTVPLNDEEWENYLNTLDEIGVDQYVQVKQDAYDRYISE